MKSPKNQHQLVLWCLYYNTKPISLLDVIKEFMFFKFQTRLSEIEREHGTLVLRQRKGFTNRFGVKSSYTTYKAISKELLKKLYEKYQ